MPRAPQDLPDADAVVGRAERTLREEDDGLALGLGHDARSLRLRFRGQPRSARDCDEFSLDFAPLAVDTGRVAAHATSSGATTEIPGLVLPSGQRDPRCRLGDLVIELGFADRELVEQVMEAERDSNEQMGAILVKSGIIYPDQLARALAERNSLDYVDLNVFEVDQGA